MNVPMFLTKPANPEPNLGKLSANVPILLSPINFDIHPPSLGILEAAEAKDLTALAPEVSVPIADSSKVPALSKNPLKPVPSSGN